MFWWKNEPRSERPLKLTMTHIHFPKFLTITLNSQRRIIKGGWWHNYLYKGNSLFWISPCSSLRQGYIGVGRWGDGHHLLAGKTMLSLFPVDRWPQLANESGLPAAHLVTRPLCGWTRWRGHCCFTALSLCGCMYRHTFTFICIRSWYSSMLFILCLLIFLSWCNTFAL